MAPGLPHEAGMDHRRLRLFVRAPLTPVPAGIAGLRGRSGFSMIEVLVVLAIIGVLAAIGLPVVGSGLRQYALNTAARNVAAEIRSARYAAVAKNRTLRLRFNCPGANQFRMVEFTGTPGIDDDADRCSLAAYPFPDTTPGAAPNADGDVLSLDPGISFASVATLEFSPTGRVSGTTELTIEVTDGTQLRTLRVAPSGRITEQ
jgi:prepilin-type N-terminal cleavage/methylation domain-containing protein